MSHFSNIWNIYYYNWLIGRKLFKSEPKKTSNYE